MQDETVVTPTETGSETETPTTTETETDEGVKVETDSPAADVDKEEPSPYEIELAELRKQKEAADALIQKKDEIIEHKNRALQAEKKKAKADPSSEDAVTERVIERLAFDRKVEAVTTDAAERDLIRHHYQNSIVRTGNVDDDLAMAVAIANRKTVMAQREAQAREEGRENYMTSFPASTARGSQKSTITDPILKQAEQLVRVRSIRMP